MLTSLVRHLHGFVRDVEPTIAEWEQAIDFLTATGQKCSDVRQEFILLSDVLGVSMLVETINERGAYGATQSTVLGPFHVVESPVRALGDTIDLVGDGEPCVVTGRVVSVDGTPLPGAVLDVWQADDKGFYDVQVPDVQPPGNGRGLFTADGEGRFWFRTIVPSYYPIPTDGPVGGLLTATRRHPYRPAHIHFIVDRGRVPPADHAHLRGRQRLHRLRRGVRGEEDPDHGLREGRRPRRGRQVRGQQPVPARRRRDRAAARLIPPDPARMPRYSRPDAAVLPPLPPLAVRRGRGRAAHRPITRLVRRSELRLADLYRRGGAYWYNGGWNWRAVVAPGVGVLLAVGGAWSAPGQGPFRTAA